jgi:hypothetical protein
MKNHFIFSIFLLCFVILGCPKVVLNADSPEIIVLQVYDENNQALDDLQFEVVFDEIKLEDLEISKSENYKNDKEDVIPTFTLASMKYWNLMSWNKYTLEEAREKCFITIKKAGYLSKTVKRSEFSTQPATVTLVPAS